jgi:hypothetical protein
MYLIVKNYFDPGTSTSHYTSFGGHYANQPTRTGVEANSTLLRGYLLAITQGLTSIVNLHGTQILHPIDVLVEDQTTAETLRKEQPNGKLATGKDADLWAAFFAKKAFFGEIRWVKNPSESDHLMIIWKWSATPPQDAEPPVVLW